jgi:hypothetical protein
MRSLTDFPFLSTSKGQRFEKSWSYCTALTSFPPLDFGNATNLIGAFHGCSALQAMPPVDTIKCKFFGGTWNSCLSLKDFPAINTSSATSLYHHALIGGAWQNCTSLTSFPFIDTSNVTNFKQAWKNCRGLSASPFPTLDMSKMRQDTSPSDYFGSLYDGDGSRQSGEGGAGCFEGVKLQTHSYSALLTSLCATNFNTNVQFHGGFSNFNLAGQDARNYLINSRGWTIGGNGILEL